MCTRTALGAIAFILGSLLTDTVWADTSLPYGIVGQFFLSEEERSQWQYLMRHPLVSMPTKMNQPVIPTKTVKHPPVSQRFELNGYLDSTQGRSVWVNQTLHSATLLKSKKLRFFKTLKPGQRIEWKGDRPIFQESYDGVETPFSVEKGEENINMFDDNVMDDRHQP